MGFGYKFDGHSREIGHIVYFPEKMSSTILINNFAMEKFIDFLDSNKMSYKVLDD